MTRSRFLTLVIAALLLSSAGLLTARDKQETFPHLTHERLFPVCVGCHEGIITGNTAQLYPEANRCANCHDGTRQPRVTYAPPGERPTNVRFSHVVHDSITAAAGESPNCQSCHASSTGAPTRMNVSGPQPNSCLSCHAHQADVHLAENATCSVCHVPLANAPSLPVARIAAFPRPPWHESPDFSWKHASFANTLEATCRTCHAQETCLRCHANAQSVPQIAALPRDARVATIEVNKHAYYPLPDSHRSSNWSFAHGVAARQDDGACANCHTQSSCLNCHLSAPGTARTVITSLPESGVGRATGVTLEDKRVHPFDFATQHGVVAASGAMQCTQCHASNTCASCHAGTTSRAFHPRNFVERHAASVFSGSGNCQSCHNTETFCRACHTQMGIASTPAMNAAFHNAQPMWVLSHGQAARTSMESCASCHRQNDCVRCHSAIGGWRVNPHGPSFPASRLAARNAASCRWCHSTIDGRSN